MREDIRPREISGELTDPIRRIDLQLNVKGIKTLYDSFQDYVAGGTLDGRLAFQSLPPVLHLLLKRYEPDVQCDAMAKVCILVSAKNH